ncbi:hypothetical protein RF11_05562 [Thelohanellus kitauei]|uniref:Uncharacterized protein n=1 Tax=Thelohanellus kitauei TaxID=669202 RepID=A0A0C2ISW8_THEKT|nr:hypothetical protein RF11_05562 [Thelohanellus kitauei]
MPEDVRMQLAREDFSDLDELGVRANEFWQSKPSTGPLLTAANLSKIRTYGQRHIKIGADFLRWFGLTVDLRNKSIGSSETVTSQCNDKSVNQFKGSSINKHIRPQFARILDDFPSIVQQNFHVNRPKHNTKNFIVTEGRPVNSKV